MVVTLCFGETCVGAFLETPGTASGQIALSSPETIGENYDASAYDASGYAVAPGSGAVFGKGGLVRNTKASILRTHRRLNHRYTWKTPPGGHWSQGMSHRFRTEMGLVGTPTQLHHWLIPQRVKWIPNYIKNQRWNLKVAANRAAHARIDTAFTSIGVKPYPLIIRPWMAMPNWARAATVGTGVGLGYGIHGFTDDD